MGERPGPSPDDVAAIRRTDRETWSPAAIDAQAFAASHSVTMAGVREALVAQFESNDAGMDIARINAYFECSGLRRAPSICLNLDQRDEFSATLAEHGLGTLTPNIHGEYKPGLDLAVVHRGGQGEAENGASFAEKMLVHELAHGSSG